MPKPTPPQALPIPRVARFLALAATFALLTAACDGEAADGQLVLDHSAPTSPVELISAPELVTLVIHEPAADWTVPGLCTTNADCATDDPCDIGVCAEGGRCAVSRLSHCSPGQLASGVYRGQVALEAATASGAHSTCTGEVNLVVDPSATPQVWGTVDCAFDGVIGKFVPAHFELVGTINGSKVNAELSAGARLVIPMGAVLKNQRVVAHIEGDGHPVFAPVRVAGDFDIAKAPLASLDDCTALPRCRQVGNSLVIEQGTGAPIVLGGQWIQLGPASIFAPGTVELNTASGPVALTSEGLEVTCGASLSFDGNVVMPIQTDVVYGWPSSTLSTMEHRGELAVVRGDTLLHRDMPADVCEAYVMITESGRQGALEMVIDPASPRLQIGFHCEGECETTAPTAFGMSNEDEYLWRALHPLQGSPEHSVAGPIYRSGDVLLPVAPGLGLAIRVDGAAVLDVGSQIKQRGELAELMLGRELPEAALESLLQGTVVAANGESLTIGTTGESDGAALWMAEGSVLVERSLVTFAGVGFEFDGSLAALGGVDLEAANVEVLEGYEVQGIISEAGLRLIVEGRIRTGELVYEHATLTIEGAELRISAHGPAVDPCEACNQ